MGLWRPFYWPGLPWADTPTSCWEDITQRQVTCRQYLNVIVKVQFQGQSRMSRVTYRHVFLNVSDTLVSPVEPEEFGLG